MYPKTTNGLFENTNTTAKYKLLGRKVTLSLRYTFLFNYFRAYRYVIMSKTYAKFKFQKLNEEYFYCEEK